MGNYNHEGSVCIKPLNFTSLHLNFFLNERRLAVLKRIRFETGGQDMPVD